MRCLITSDRKPRGIIGSDPHAGPAAGRMGGLEGRRYTAVVGAGFHPARPPGLATRPDPGVAL